MFWLYDLDELPEDLRYVLERSGGNLPRGLRKAMGLEDPLEEYWRRLRELYPDVVPEYYPYGLDLY
ncbi:hypothetical protein SAMN00808754_1456 [Thermanaeromonas toyohensis ToBE]|uniref:Uncharacterized protein n=1 Tax=Thermanaeromonas toyohensis ToBE TaxID=698762 RepID=A0A1W1VST2_9FIRM|nr:hypothetical protein [Thermanaeromonas toyohensis]SMB96333.1 hypothetical protein SAMN00808754_1456 [Thermanaeromonas toyohensis ToBE]